MKVSNKSFPYPVLGNKDDIAGEFDVHFRYELRRDATALVPEFELKHETIQNLIMQGKASYVAEVECRNAFFRAAFPTRRLSERIKIPPELLRDRVNVGFFVCADADISGYKPADCHSDYAGASFDIEAGDILAVGGYVAFDADKDFDPLRPPVASFMAIREGTRQQSPMEVDYEGDKITIRLSKSDWIRYCDIKQQAVSVGTLHASVVLPTLIDAIYQVQQHGSDYEDYRWFGRLEDMLEARGLQGKDPYEAAQKILDMPATRNFEGLAKMLEAETDETYE